MADHKVHWKTKKKIIDMVLARKAELGANPSWNRLINAPGGPSIPAWHKLMSPVTEYERGYCIINTTTLAKAEKVLKLDPGTLVNIALKGAEKVAAK